MTLEELVSSILEVAPAELTDQVSRSNLSNWSSLAHINLISALEEVYDVRFSTAEINDLKTLGEVRQLLRRKGAAV